MTAHWFAAWNGPGRDSFRRHFLRGEGALPAHVWDRCAKADGMAICWMVDGSRVIARPKPGGAPP